MLEKDAADAAIRQGLGDLVAAQSFGELAQILEAAPSVEVARHLWRRLEEVLRHQESAAGQGFTHIFALPLIIVAGAANATALAGVVPEIDRLSAVLQEHRALRGNRNFALGNALVAADALSVAELGRLLAQGADPLALPVAAMPLLARQESVFLRFLVGVAVSAPEVDLFGRPEINRWGAPLGQELVRQLGAEGLTLLVLPRPPGPLLSAVWAGRLAQREVALQLFASNAIRKLRAAVGEPTAVISSHTLPAGQGEVRVSLSSPFDLRSAEGFCIRLEPLDRVQDVAQGVVDLLRDCRVQDIRFLTQVQPDRDALTGGPLLFKPENLGPNEVRPYRQD